METWKLLGLLLIAVVLAAVAAVLAPRIRRARLDGLKAKPLMTDNEREFFHRLERALPGYYVFPQVAFASFLTHDSSMAGSTRIALRNRFDRKMADFVVCERETLSIVALVELDDRSHRATNDQQRDEITRSAGYRTVRFRSKQKPTEAEIANTFNPEGKLSVDKLKQPRAARA